MWKYRWLTLLAVAVFVFVAAAYALLSPFSYRAVATLVVEDPKASALFDVGNAQNPQRYVADQAAILESAVVAGAAAERIPSLGSSEEVLENLDVFFSDNSNQLSVIFTDDAPEEAVAGANAVADAYGSVREEASVADLQAAVVQLDNSIAEVEKRIAELQLKIEDELQGDPSRDVLDDQLDDALGRLVELQAELPIAENERLAELRAELDDINQQIQTLLTLRNLDRQSSRLAALLDEQSQTISRKADLLERKDELGVEARTASDGIVLSSPAVVAEEVGAELSRLVAFGLVLGLLVAAGASYLLALRNRTFEDRSQPELVLGEPLLAEIPSFRQERIRSEVPVRTAPSSSSAEAFRFISAALDIESESNALTSARGSHIGEGHSQTVQSFVFVSAGLGDGKSVVTANTALASARQGKRVVAIDGDFGSQRLTELLMGELEKPPWGITNFVERSVPFEHVRQRVHTEEGSRLDLVSRGTIPVAAPDFFRSAGVKAFFEAIRDEYDVIIVDSPPMLRVAYSTLLVRYADRTIAVVPHKGLVSRAEDLTDRIEYLEAGLMGYVYNKAPLRGEMTGSYGSLQDVVVKQS